jgi:hypothetical protein
MGKGIRMAAIPNYIQILPDNAICFLYKPGVKSGCCHPCNICGSNVIPEPAAPITLPAVLLP